MKKIIILTALIFPVFFISELAAQKDGEFDYPEDSTTESSKKIFVKQFKQGKVLYSISCAKCHNLKEGGKEFIPDFSLPQLLDYEMRFYYPEHQERLNDTQITDEEMKKIILFLQFKKKSGKPIH